MFLPINFIRKQVLSLAFRVLKPCLSIVICLQLSIYPFVSQAQNSNKPAKINQKSLTQIKDLNSKVQSLRKYMFGKDAKSSGHPLDPFSLIGQSLSKKPAQPAAKATLANSKDKKIGFFKRSSNKIKTSISAPVTSLFSLERLLFEVRTQTTKNDVGKKEALLSYGEASWSPNLLRDKDKDLYVGKQYIVNSADAHTFTISYQDKVLHYFDKQISWIASFKNYIVFLDSNFINKDQTTISFIDLEYFSEAIGSTKLPIFSLPVSLDSKQLASLKNPNSIEVTDKELKIGSFIISANEMLVLSRLQQMGFNATVSMISPEAQQYNVQEIRDLLSSYKEGLQEHIPELKQNPNKESYKKVLNIIQSYLEIRNDLGSSQNKTSSFARQDALRRKVEKTKTKAVWFQKFSEAIDQDISFQKDLKQMSDHLESKTKVNQRFLSFIMWLTRPQPLGAPKIERALGYLAGTVLPGESFASRMTALKEATAHFYSFKIPRYGTAALVGMAAMAHPDSSYLLSQMINTSVTWFAHIGELFSVSGKSAFAFLGNTDALPDAYINDGKSEYFIKGLAALATMTLGSLGLMSISINSHYLKRAYDDYKVKHHRQKAKTTLLNFKDFFVSHMNQQRQAFVENLGASELTKIGLPMDIELSKDSSFRLLFQTGESRASLTNAFESKKEIRLELASQTGRGVPITMVLVSDPNKDSSLHEESSLKVQFEHKKSSYSRSFFIDKEESTTLNLNRFFNEDTNRLQLHSKDAERANINMNFSGSELQLKADAIDGRFTDKDEQALKKAFVDYKKQQEKVGFFKKIINKFKKTTPESIVEQTQDFQKNIEQANDGGLSVKEIKTVRQAIGHFLIGYSSLANTFQSLGLAWNKGFIGRNYIVRPSLSFSAIYFTNFFKRNYSDNHKATTFNGGYNVRVKDIGLKALCSISCAYKELNTAKKATERDIIRIEKHFLKASIKYSHFHFLTRIAAKNDKSSRALRAQAHNSFEKLGKKDKMTYTIFQRALFLELTKDFIKEKLNLSGDLSESQLKKQTIELLKTNPKFLETLTLDTEEETFKRVERIVQKQNLIEVSQKISQQFFNNFLKKAKLKQELQLEKTLNPETNSMMKRYNIAEKYLRDPEALARATRSFTTGLVIDKPIELLFTFLIFAGVDQGLLQVLHETPFSENAFLHLGRYVIWYGFFTNIILSCLTDTWMKVQQDFRLADIGGFDTIPELKDSKKRFSYQKWYLKGLFSKDNSLFKNYIYSLQIAWANFGAAMVTISILHYITFGRIDLDFIVAGYLLYMVTPLYAVSFQLENAFETSVNHVFTKLNIDFKGKYKHLLSHPDVQNFKIKESAKLRVKYNLILAILFDNPVGGWVDTFINIDTSVGPRAFQRIFFGYYTPTEWLVEFANWAEDKGVSPSITKACKSIFTKNRTDLINMD